MYRFTTNTQKQDLNVSYILFLFFFACLLAFSVQGQASSFEKLHSDIGRVSQQYYIEAARELHGTFYIKKKIKSLEATIIKLTNNDQYALANAVILANMPLIKKNIDKPEFSTFLSQLLDHNIWDSAEDLASYALTEGRYYTQEKARYLLAEYFFSHNDYDNTIKYLTAIESSKPLSAEERDYATLMFGIILQKQKKHREALEIYKKIQPGSQYYRHSRLNIAIAHIRQGWWTDAQLAIEEALSLPTPEKQPEINNRLLLVLGYSQLQHEFYRNARLTFRKIGLDSQYMNRALHGIGRCALSQKDYLGAINAFTYLQTSENPNLSTYESYLLLPYAQNKMGDLDKASLGYTEAVTYFEVKTREIDAQVAVLKAQPEQTISETHMALLPELSQQTHKMINQLDIKMSSPTIQKKVTSLRLSLNEALSRQTIDKLAEHKEYLKSYLSQSQYGLAKLYDSP